MMWRKLSGAVFSVACLCFILLGCGGGVGEVEFPETVPFSGTITMDGKPLANHMISLVPADSNTKTLGMMDFTDADGKYEISTFAGANQKPGAIPGEYTVRISSMVPNAMVDPNGKEIAGAAVGAGALIESVPEKYSHPLKTTLKASVGASGGSQDFELTSK